METFAAKVHPEEFSQHEEYPMGMELDLIEEQLVKDYIVLEELVKVVKADPEHDELTKLNTEIKVLQEQARIINESGLTTLRFQAKVNMLRKELAGKEVFVS